MRLARKSNSREVMDEGIVGLRNFLRNPSMVPRMQITSVDCLAEVVRQYEQ